MIGILVNLFFNVNRIKNGNTSILGTISMAYANMVHSNSPTVGIVCISGIESKRCCFVLES